MILYSVQCALKHVWEAWFASAASFDTQVAQGLVECPLCGCQKTERAIMAPNVARADHERSGKIKPVAGNAEAPISITSESKMGGMALPEPLMEAMAQWRDHLEKNCDDVGDKFAQEARAMADKEIAERPIYGTAKPQEVKELLEDGIDVLPVPALAVPNKKSDLH